MEEKKKTPRVEMTVEEFGNAVRSQGVPIEQVTFRCPRCGLLQSANDLIEAGVGKDMSEVESYIAFSCVGRFSKEKGCDWTLGGLFQIHELVVIDEDGKAHPRFMPVKAEVTK